MRGHVVWVRYEPGEPWFALPRPARWGKEEPPLTEEQACREARWCREHGTPAKALPAGVDPNKEGK